MVQRTPVSLYVLDGVHAVCRLDAADPVPEWGRAGPLWSVTRTPDELSVVCAADAVPAGVRSERGWKALAVAETLAFELVGIMAGLTGVLARAGVPLFALSTHDTDLLLVRAADLERAVAALRAAGHEVRD